MDEKTLTLTPGDLTALRMALEHFREHLDYVLTETTEGDGMLDEAREVDPPFKALSEKVRAL